MPQASYRSQLRNREDGVRDDRDGRRDYPVFQDEQWYLDEDFGFASIPGLDDDTRSAAYILHAVEALSRPAGTAQRGLGLYRPDASEVHAEWRMMHRRKAMLHVHYHGIATRSLKKICWQDAVDDNRRMTIKHICQETTMLQDSSDEEAASSIRTDSSLDDIDSIPGEVLDGAALDYRRSLDTEFGAVTSTMLPSLTNFGAQSEMLELQHTWGIYYGERWDGPRIASNFVGVLVFASLFGMYWAGSRSDIQGAFDIRTYMFILAAIVFFIADQRDMRE